MTIEEMKSHEWIVGWSGGKDSTATIILMHENGIPIKKIRYVRMMYNENLPATLPEMTEFVDRAKDVFKSWGYNVEIIPSYRTLVELANRRYKRSAMKERIGCLYGVTATMRGFCSMTFVKAETLRRVSKKDSDEYQMIGYAADETKRIHRLNGNKASILVELGAKEKDTFSICEKYNLLSPLYRNGITRDGCWFCPNAGKRERASKTKSSRACEKNLRSH